MKQLLSACVLLGVVALVLGAPSVNEKKKVVCYWGTWAVYRWGDGLFDVENIDPYICTHIIYTFVGLGTDNRMRLLDPYYDLEENWGKGAMKRFNRLKELNPELKTILAVGGWNEGSAQYSIMAETPEGRQTFIQSVLEFLPKEGFDGFDLDWEYPTHRGGRPQDRENFVKLAAEMKAAFQPHGYLLTGAVAAGNFTAVTAYDVPEMAKHFDFINLMSYDFHGFWENHDYVHHNAPMTEHPMDYLYNNSMLSVTQSVDLWLELGLPKEKLVLGMPTYGRGWTLSDPNNHDVYATAYQPIDAGTWTMQAGFWGYNEICIKLQNEAGQWTVVRDPYFQAPYAYNGAKWIGYDDEESIAVKANFAVLRQLGGVMLWSVETDDFRGRCGEPYALTKTAYRILNGDIVIPPTPSTTTTTRDPSLPPESTTTTTTPNPNTPPPSDICKKPGFNPDPDDCAAFYYCTWDGSQWNLSPRRCPSGTVFNPAVGVCDYPDNVPGCEAK